MRYCAAWAGRRVVLVLLALLALVSCSPRAATQIVVRVDVDPTLAGELQRVELSAFLEGQEQRPIVGDAGYDLTRYALPGDVVIAAADADEARRLVVRVTGVTTGALRGTITQRAIVAFRREQTILLSIYLARQCLTVMCGPDQTCGNDGRCRPVDQPTLGLYAPVDASIDRAGQPDGPDDIAKTPDRMDTDAAMDATDAMDAADPVDVMDAAEVVDAMDVTEVVDAPDIGDVMDVADVVDAPGIEDAMDVVDVVDAPGIEDVVDVVDAAVDALEASVDAPDAVDAPADAATDAVVADAGCPAGFADCDRNPANGCETNLLSSTNCGACGRTCGGSAVYCAPMGGAIGCVAGCPSDLAMCGSVCASTQTDARHCGACGARCAPGQGCVAGACVCQAPYRQCAGQCVDVRSDLDNCGACGSRAGMLQGCRDGALVPVVPTQIALNETVCVRMSDATARCWGRNDAGQIDSSGMHRLRPVRLPFRDVARVYVFNSSVCVLFNDRTARCQAFDLGSPRFAITATPGIVALGIGTNFGCGVFGDGSVHCFGQTNEYGQLGVGDSRATYGNPVVARPTTVGADQIHVLNASVCVRMLSGRLRCWGRNTNGSIGSGASADVFLPVELPLMGVDSLGSQGTTTGAHRCARLEAGGLVCWGHGMSGQLGYGDTSDRALASGIVGGTANVADFVVGDSVTFARTASSTALQWGSVRAGGAGRVQPTPMEVSGLTGVTAVAHTSWSTCVIRGGDVHCWGYNSYGELGDGTNVRRDTPAPVMW